MNKRFHQKLVSEAYDIWCKNKDWSYEEFVNALDEKHKVAVLVGDFDYQVKNGGFFQWGENRYSEKAHELFEVLDKFVKDTNSVAGKKVIDLLESYMNDLEPFYSRPLTDEMYDSDVRYVELLTNKYYEISRDFLEEFDKWLIKKYGNVE